MGEMERVILQNTEPGHNKQYTVFIEQVNGVFQVVGRWGPIGEKWTKSQVKGQSASLSGARGIVYDLVSKKERRDYRRRVCR